MLLPFT